MWKAAVDEKFIVLFLYGWRNWGNNCNRNLMFLYCYCYYFCHCIILFTSSLN